MKEHPIPSQNLAIRFLNRLFVIIDDVILVLVALGIIAVAGILMYEAVTDVLLYSQHSVSHIVSDMMFVLIIMELFRQVMRQINRHVFSLNPFIFIGVIASIRGLLLTQMNLAMGEIEWKEGVTQLLMHATIVLILVAAFFVYSRGKKGSED